MELITEEQQRALIEHLNGKSKPKRPKLMIPVDCVTPGYYVLNALIRDPELLEEVNPQIVRIARDLLPYERPRLAATALIEAPGFAEMLDAAIARSEAAQRNAAKVIPPVQIERQVSGPTGPEPTKLGAPFVQPRRVVMDRRI
jgi:hypothetical protein